MSEHPDGDHPEPATTERPVAARPVAPGGWRRAMVGLVVGLLAGAAIAFVLPRDDLPRRRPSRQDG